jgi:hypothetical protein
MNKTAVPFQSGSKVKQLAATAGLRTRLTHLSLMDWVAIVTLLVGVWIAVYTTSMRHP